MYTVLFRVDLDVQHRVRVFFELDHFVTIHVVIGKLLATVISAVRLFCYFLAADHFVFELDVCQLVFQLCWVRASDQL